MIKQGINYTDVEASLDGRCISVKINSNTRIINLYSLSGSQNKQERESFFTDTVAYHLRKKNETFIIGGDFNCV